MNAAWGQAVLLLDMMTRMYPDFKWEQGMLKPLGSHSMVHTLSASTASCGWLLLLMRRHVFNLSPIPVKAWCCEELWPS